MASIMGRLVTLQSLRDELEQLAAWDRVREAGDRRERERDRREQGRAPGVERVEIPWAGSWWLTAPQRRVVAVLLEALGSRSQDVDERVLSRAAGAPPGAKLRDVFAGVEGWDRLVLRGARAGAYRLAPPPEDGGEEDARIDPE